MEKMGAETSTTVSFSQFYGGREPEEYIYEDEQCVAFDEKLDDRQAPVHFLVVPKKTIPTLCDASVDHERLLGHLLLVARNIAIQKGLQGNGYHVMVDEHYRMKKLKSIHVFQRALHHMLWPMGPGHKL